jgi:Dyp-type peroxidase family
MGARPVSSADWRKRPSWKLSAPTNARAQGLVVSGFVGQEHAAALFLEFDWSDPGRCSGAWLRALAEICPIGAADGPDPKPAAIAFTYTGLERLGVRAEALESFQGAFREGMTQVDRLRRLGDRRGEDWQGTVIPEGYHWSGNAPLASDDTVERIPTPCTVHAMLLVYDATEDAVEQRVKAVTKAIEPHGVKVVRRLPLSVRLDDKGIGREHFGFADGLSQPVPFEDGAVVYGDGRNVERDRWHGIPLGDVLIGHQDAHHEIAPGPVVRDDTAGDPASADLPAEGAPAGYRNFGLDGSYLVVRELRQDVPAFWHSLDEGTKKLRDGDPKNSGHVTAKWLAERVVGRDIDGHLLCPKSPNGLLPPDEYGQPQNAFGFLEEDPHGRGCPVGSHVRRGNPRDGLAKDKGSAQTLLDAANNHRVLRRGRKFGKTIAEPRTPDGEDRGLLFICLNTDIARQFEFVQQTWLLNSNFATLYDEVDPLIGPKGTMTIREDPLRRIVEVETFVQCAGGEYFFLPSIPALKYLAAR